MMYQHTVENRWAAQLWACAHGQGDAAQAEVAPHGYNSPTGTACKVSLTPLPVPQDCGLGKRGPLASQGTGWGWRLGRDLKKETWFVRGNPLPLRAPVQQPCSGSVPEAPPSPSAMYDLVCRYELYGQPREGALGQQGPPCREGRAPSAQHTDLSLGALPGLAVAPPCLLTPSAPAQLPSQPVAAQCQPPMGHRQTSADLEGKQCRPALSQAPASQRTAHQVIKCSERFCLALPTDALLSLRQQHSILGNMEAPGQPWYPLLSRGRLNSAVRQDMTAPREGPVGAPMVGRPSSGSLPLVLPGPAPHCQRQAPHSPARWFSALQPSPCPSPHNSVSLYQLSEGSCWIKGPVGNFESAQLLPMT